MALELKMRRLFATLSEKDRRPWAAIEAARRGPTVASGLDTAHVFDIDSEPAAGGVCGN